MTKHRAVRKVLRQALVCNLAVALAKLSYGVLTGTMSMIADGFHSLADAGSSIIGLIAVHVAGRPSDPNHHYGHSKFETLATLAISAMIGITGWEILKNAVGRIFEHPTLTFHPVGLWIMVITMIVNFLLSSYERAQAKKLHSHILAADAYHTMSDLWVSLSVIISLVAIRSQHYWVDAVVSLGIALYFFSISYKLIKVNILILSDAAPIDREKLRTLVLNVPGVIDCHQVRARGLPNEAFVDLHIQVDAKTTTAESHDMNHTIEATIKQQIPGIKDILIHTEPYPDPHTEGTVE